MAAVQQVHNLVCEHTCLARAGAGYNKLGAAEILYGGALGIVVAPDMTCRRQSSELVDFRHILKSCIGQPFLQFSAVYIKAAAEVIETAILIAQLHVYSAEKHERVVR